MYWRFIIITAPQELKHCFMEQQEKKKGFRKLEERLLNQLGFYRSNYLKYWVIAAIDVVIATFCSVFVFLIYAPIEGPFSRRNVLIVIVLAVIINMISFYLFKTYRNIIRYTTVKGLLPLGYSVAVKSVILTCTLFCRLTFTGNRTQIPPYRSAIHFCSPGIHTCSDDHCL